MLAAADFSNPLLWAVIIGWIFTVVLHEFAHGLVGYLGGDYTVRERGGLSLNPLQYIDPVNSIILPAVFLMMGGIPLPGGATFVRRDLLRKAAMVVVMTCRRALSAFCTAPKIARLSASVPALVNTISPGSAPMRAATCRRAVSRCCFAD